MLDVPLVSSALAVNASIWDAFCVILFHKNLPLWGVSAGLMAAGFQTLAMCTMQPHVLGALNGVGVVFCFWLSSGVADAKCGLAFFFVVVGSVVGLLGIKRQTGTSVVPYSTVLSAFFAGYFLAIFFPLFQYFKKGSAFVRETKLRYLIPFADGCVSVVATTLLMMQSARHLYSDTVLILLVGIISFGTSWFSLHHNAVKTHLIIAYPLWSFGLIAADLSGGYNVNVLYLVLQFLVTACGVGLLVLKPPRSACCLN